MDGKNGLTYRDAGVDIDAGERAVELFAPHAKRATRPEVVGGVLEAECASSLRAFFAARR